MLRKPTTLFACLLATGVSTSGFADSVSLLPVGAVENVLPGETVTLNVVIDFSEHAQGTLGGGFDIQFEPTALQFVNWLSAETGDPAFRRAPDVSRGLLESGAVAEFNGLSQEVSLIIGTVEFQVLEGIGANTQVSISSTGGVGGPWVSVDGTSILTPTYHPVTVTRGQEAFFEDGFESN